MAWDEVASGTNIIDIPNAESYIPEGSRAILRLELGSLPAPSLVLDLQDRLSFMGVSEVSVVSQGNTIDIHYRKGFAWLPVIIVALIILAIAVVLWRVLVEVPGASIVLPIIAIGALVLTGLLVVKSAKR